MILKDFEEEMIIESEDMGNFCVFRLDNITLIYSKNEKFIISCMDINEHLIKVKGLYHFYKIDGDDIIISDDCYNDFFIFDSIVDDILISKLIFLKLDECWMIYDTLRNEFISDKKFVIEQEQIDLLKNDTQQNELHIKFENGENVIINLLYRTIS